MTNIIIFDKILFALKKCGELNIALIFSWRSTQVAEEAPVHDHIKPNQHHSIHRFQITLADVIAV